MKCVHMFHPCFYPHKAHLNATQLVADRKRSARTTNLSYYCPGPKYRCTGAAPDLDIDSSAEFLQLAQEGAEQRGLAGADHADDGRQAAPADAQGDVTQRRRRVRLPGERAALHHHWVTWQVTGIIEKSERSSDRSPSPGVT